MSSKSNENHNEWKHTDTGGIPHVSVCNSNCFFIQAVFPCLFFCLLLYIKPSVLGKCNTCCVWGVPLTIDDLERKEIRGLKYQKLRGWGHINLLVRQTVSRHEAVPSSGSLRRGRYRIDCKKSDYMASNGATDSHVNMTDVNTLMIFSVFITFFLYFNSCCCPEGR